MRAFIRVISRIGRHMASFATCRKPAVMRTEKRFLRPGCDLTATWLRPRSDMALTWL